MRELIYISLLAGFVSGLAAALIAVYLLFSLPPLPLSRPMLPSGRRANRANSLHNPPLLAQPSGGGWRLRHPAPSDWATTFQTKNTRARRFLAAAVAPLRYVVGTPAPLRWGFSLRALQS